MPLTGLERFRTALTGARVYPPPRGMSFVAPRLLPGWVAAGEDEAAALDAVCRGHALDFCFIPMDEPWATDAVRALARRGVAVLGVIDGVVWGALESMGFEEGLLSAGRGSESLVAEMDAALARSLAGAERALAGGVDALVIADDIAGTDGPMLAPAYLAEHAMPRLASLCERARAVGVPALLHCDGDARLLHPLLADAGFAALHGDCGGADRIVAALDSARACGLALAGGIPTGSLSHAGVAALAGALAASMAEAGGVLVADDGGVTTPEQAAALIAALDVASGA